MKISRRCVAAASLLALGGAVLCATGPAQATPVVTDPLVTLKSGAAPTGIVAGPNGSFYTLNSGADSIIGFDSKGTQFGGAACVLPSGSAATDIARLSNGDLVATGPGTHSFSICTPTTGKVLTTTLALDVKPFAVAVNSSDAIFTVNGIDNTITELVPSTGKLTPEFVRFDTGTIPQGIAIDAAGNIFTANGGNGTISKITPAGSVTKVFATLPTGNTPYSIAVDKAGFIYVASENKSSVIKIDSSKSPGVNVVETIPLPAGIGLPSLEVDELGNVFVADSGTGAVEVIRNGSTTATSVLTKTATMNATSLALSTDGRLLIASKAPGTVAALNLETKIVTSTVAPGTVGAPYSATIAATGVGDLTYSLSAYPSWLWIDPVSGKLSGTPTAAGSGSFVVRAVSSIGRSENRTLTFDVVAATTTPPTGGAGTGGSGSSGTSGTSGSAGSASAAKPSTSTTTSLAHTGLGDVGLLSLVGVSALLLGAAGAVGNTILRRRRRASLR